MTSAILSLGGDAGVPSCFESKTVLPKIRLRDGRKGLVSSYAGPEYFADEAERLPLKHVREVLYDIASPVHKRVPPAEEINAVPYPFPNLRVGDEQRCILEPTHDLAVEVPLVPFFLSRISVHGGEKRIHQAESIFCSLHGDLPSRRPVLRVSSFDRFLSFRPSRERGGEKARDQREKGTGREQQQVAKKVLQVRTLSTQVAPRLSPTERDETTRFGIHDDEAFADIVEHYDETPECAMGGHPAHARLIANCCGNVVAACETHIRAHLVWVDVHLVLAAGVECVKCKERFRYPATVADVCREVPL